MECRSDSGEQPEALPSHSRLGRVGGDDGKPLKVIPSGSTGQTAAFEAIASTLPRQRRSIQINRSPFAAMRGPAESFSDVILRLVRNRH